MKKNTLLFLVLLPLFTLAQERRIGMDLMTPLINPALVFTYEQTYSLTKNQFVGFRAGIGTAQYFLANQFTVQGVYYLGRKHQLELAPGFIYETNFRTWRSEGIIDSTMNPLSHHKGALFLRIGYVYNTSGKWSFRAGVNPAILFYQNLSTSFVPPVAPYVGISYRFK